MAELCPETAFSGRIWSAHGGLGKKPNEIEVFAIPVCNTRCYTCPSDVATAHLTFQFTANHHILQAMDKFSIFLV